MRIIKLPFVPGLQVDFADRDPALRRIVEWAERGTRFVKVIYGPEGCGKTAWLKQSIEILRELNFNVIYVNPIEETFLAEVNIPSIKRDFTNLVREAISQSAVGRIVWNVINLAREAISAGSGRLAIIIDDAFQVIGVRESAIYVKGLLGVIEYPSASYDRIVAIVATSEGLSRVEIGRHLWAEILPIWNMPKNGFEKLYSQIPGGKLSLEDAWMLTGGNPRMLALLYENNWSIEGTVNELIKFKDIDQGFVKRWRNQLEKAVEDPDYLWFEAPRELVNKLIAKNLIIYNMYDRDLQFWIDEPPPIRDPELGIGKYVAWQTPLHREAVKRALENLGS